MPGPEVPFPLSMEPGVPFPLTDDRDGETAEKYDFCRDCPFPHEQKDHIHQLSGQKQTRALGRGTYNANAIAGVVTITASGMAPNLNTTVQLVQLPLMIWPPRFALYFSSPEIVLPATHPFKVEAHLLTHQRLIAIIVQDADGIHRVDVQNF